MNNKIIENLFFICCIFIILSIIFPKCYSIGISTDYCDTDDDLDSGWMQWYREVYISAKANRNTTDRLMELNDKLQRQETSFKDILYQLQTKMEHVETEIKDILERLETKLDNVDKRMSKMEHLITKIEMKNKCYQHPSDRIIIQRRMDGTENFDRPWNDYKQGFGKRGGEFFIGLEQLHKLTTGRQYELVIVMEDFKDDCRYAKYEHFVVANETEKYQLIKLGQYTGTAGDSLSYNLGTKFTTKDQDNDTYGTKNCALLHKGGWWYWSCSHSNLNGKYLEAKSDDLMERIYWQTFGGFYYALKFVEMSLIPK
ncbi:microfibril-associated glycoprotein 4-like isoform X1 [Musca autumnalis]|uniref:microfibril-associated glycoprotein 4-like isoform X1 n=1 Tax=Musca autumnalis TaxID=221902 RepID=UPI003CEC941B